MQFRFKRMWFRHLELKVNMKQWWEEPIRKKGTYMFIIYQKIKNLKGKLKEWNKSIFGNIFDDRKRIEKEIANLNNMVIQNE